MGFIFRFFGIFGVGFRSFVDSGRFDFVGRIDRWRARSSRSRVDGGGTAIGDGLTGARATSTGVVCRTGVSIITRKPVEILFTDTSHTVIVGAQISVVAVNVRNAIGGWGSTLIQLFFAEIFRLAGW